ncbi:hypothetical protein [Methylocapsa sp. S129]|uniref:DUF805 domain-containing protein n=1 Tax=Methylocapsa sp. S129 TaxID=1641869 RepID=UPI00131A8854|nr:hypothetical protein [Methylocapsa sp. S129]
MGETRGKRFRFLYRQSEGTIDRRQFWLASWPPLAIMLALTLIWIVVMPRQARDLSHEALIDWGVAATYAYLLVYVFALFLCAVAEYFVWAKRFADRGRPQAFAGLALFALFLAGAAHWYQPRSEGTMPDWLTWAFDALALGVLAWTIAELGFGESERR